MTFHRILRLGEEALQGQEDNSHGSSGRGSRGGSASRGGRGGSTSQRPTARSTANAPNARTISELRRLAFFHEGGVYGHRLQGRLQPGLIRGICTRREDNAT